MKGDCHTYHVREGLAREDHARDDLRETAGLDVPNLDEAGVEEQHVWRMPCDVFCGAFPFDHLHRVVGTSPVGVPVTVHVQTEFYQTSGPHQHNTTKFSLPS